MRDFQPIENYGIIGDLNTIALVALDGSIDFMCFPNFDSPTIFASLLDREKGGYFDIKPVFGEMKNKQLYFPDTNVLLTRFLSTEGVGEITDFMPVEELLTGKQLIRRVTTIRGKVTYRVSCKPRFNYGRSSHKTVLEGNDIVFYSEGKDQLILKLKSTVPLIIKEGDAFAEFTLNASETADFLLEQVGMEKHTSKNLNKFVDKSLNNTLNYWKDWMSNSTYEGRWMEIVNRSALILKLLTSFKHGSMVAAATFGLPENVGGIRNWDYRYTWIRDAAFTMYAFIRLGYTKEAGAFMKWVEKECEDIKGKGPLGLMYSIDGRPTIEAEELVDWEGYKGSKPVRIGNVAYKQLQLDIYGELMDSVYLYNKYGEPISYDFWCSLKFQIDWLANNWEEPDHGIWEVRGGKKKFLYSRLMCWVALDRSIRLAEGRSFPYPEDWKKQRDNIFNSIYKKFWNESKKAFVQFEGSDSIDAAALLMPLIRFISPRDPRWLSTLECIERELVSDSLVYRYIPDKAASDGLVGDEGTFSMCTFWYVECLSRAGQLKKARFYFEKMLGYANHLGLYSEQLGLQGEHLGNFPQAFTHLGLISAAYDLNRRLNDERNKGLENHQE
jgi:GH15 family glucan-1,4-alpha-glucosidase